VRHPLKRFTTFPAPASDPDSPHHRGADLRIENVLSLHSYLCAEHVQALRTRIGDMREPRWVWEEVPHEALAVFFDEILAAPTTAALLISV